MTPQALGAYDLLEEIGAGGGGRVYRARQRGLDRVVAIKILEAPAGNAEMRARFKREMKVLADLSHPSVIRLYDGDVQGDQAWYAMELVEGASLAKELQGGMPLPLKRATSVGLQMLSSLAYVHARGIVHRDIKPSNILLAEDGRAILSDFGLALVNSSTRLTQADHLMGSPRYIPPERFANQEDSPRGDLWQLGAVMYEMLTGQPAVDGRTMVEIIERARDFVAPHAAALNASVPAQVDAVVFRLLSPRPDGRYVTAQDALVDLAGIVKRAGGTVSTLVGPIAGLRPPADRRQAGPEPARPTDPTGVENPSSRHVQPHPAPQLVAPSRPGAGTTLSWGVTAMRYGVAFALGVAITAGALHDGRQDRSMRAPHVLSPSPSSSTAALSPDDAQVRLSRSTARVQIGLAQVELRWTSRTPFAARVAVTGADGLPRLAEIQERFPLLTHAPRFNATEWPRETRLEAHVQIDHDDVLLTTFQIPVCEPKIVVEKRTATGATLRLLSAQQMVLKIMGLQKLPFKHKDSFDVLACVDLYKSMLSSIRRGFTNDTWVVSADGATLELSDLDPRASYSEKCEISDDLDGKIAIPCWIPPWSPEGLNWHLSEIWKRSRAPGQSTDPVSVVKQESTTTSPMMPGGPLSLFEGSCGDNVSQVSFREAGKFLGNGSTPVSERGAIFGSLTPWLLLETVAQMEGQTAPFHVADFIGKRATYDRPDFFIDAESTIPLEIQIQRMARAKGQLISGDGAMGYAMRLSTETATFWSDPPEELALINMTSAGRRAGERTPQFVPTSVTSAMGSVGPSIKVSVFEVWRDELRHDVLERYRHVDISLVTSPLEEGQFLFALFPGWIAYLGGLPGGPRPDTPLWALRASLPSAALQGERALSGRGLIRIVAARIGRAGRSVPKTDGVSVWLTAMQFH